MKIKNVKIDNNIFLAPMAGVSDVSFRHICKLFGAGLTYTEMVSVKGLYHKSKKTIELLETSPLERPVAVQLFGNDPQVFYEVIKSGVLDKFDIIDINMGCPAPKIVKNGDGSALLKNLDLAKRIIESCVSATQKPITVKYRMGFGINSNIALEFAKMCKQCKVSAITLHPRTREQFFSGKANLEVIKQIKQQVDILVIGNGDVSNKCTYEDMLKTGCDAVMIGRGALGNPQIFSELANKNPPLSKLETIKLHYKLMVESIGSQRANKNFKKHLLWYLGGEKNANEIKRKVALMDNYEDIFAIIEDFF